MSSRYQTRLPAGAHWSLLMRSGSALQLTDLQGGVNVGMLMYNPNNPLERYNAPDSLKCQHTFRLTAGHCLYSDMGRIFCGIEQDSFGWHESVCGTANARQVAEQFGARDYQQARNDWHQNGYDSFLVELAKYGLGKRDMAACVNFFAEVHCSDNGELQLIRQGEKGAQVTLRFAMDTLLLLHTCPHPLSAASSYPRGALGIVIDGEPAPLPEICLQPDENQRGLRNNQLYHLGAAL
ncbi:urea carboxylase-associated protein 2 [Erwinia toletana]|uniref:Urea carboxylase-associated protein 2 n=1 Tax=Winslowiella toletana TaxID=92490 RepID=A0ABS4P8F0_9GAMM|nr:urea amidolyase associated protein UAAP1 [Winslowiella toletana]MBP2168923.1 urea carboxylase-associated protein 2 [Winslowiella toletana]